MDTIATVAAGTAALNVVLLVSLMYLYVRMAARTHAGYTYGLTIFSGLLLAQNSVMVYLCALLTNLYDWQLSPYFAAVALLEFAGLLALFKVTI
ncbi:MAG TPA: hypothetical protein VEB87_07260 [Nitrososphaerales archaeon]|nr:hypothetical protein [Nitrososphaerales archaeon]